MVAFRSKQRRAMPIPAGANQSRHSGENGKLGLEARLPAIQRKALHRRTWAAAMRNRGNGIKKPSRQTAEHSATGLPRSKWWERRRAAGAQPPTSRLLLRPGMGRERKRDLLGRGEKVCGDGEKAAPKWWCQGKRLPAALCLPTMLCPAPLSTPRNAVSAWDGDCPPLSQLLLLTVPQPEQHLSSRLGYQQGLGSWVSKPRPALLHGGPGHHSWGSGGRKSPAVGRQHPPAQPTLGDWDGP